MTTGEINSKVAGVTARNLDGQRRQDIIRQHCHPGDPVWLVREPNNAHDRNAIQVRINKKVFWIFDSSEQIGYISASLAAEFASQIDRGLHISASISNITGGENGKSLGVNILVKKHYEC